MSQISKSFKKYSLHKTTRIEVSGGIAAGKTTLAKLMRDYGFNAVLENYRANPFIRSFYSNPTGYAFETEITFLLQHYSQIKTSSAGQQILICDYSLYL